MILALETAQIAGTVALWQAGELVAEYELPPQSRSAQSLAPGIEELLHQTGITRQQLSAIACVVGPGSFTGLRIGVTTAKVLAWGLNLPVVAILSTDVLAEQARDLLSPDKPRLLVGLDAHRDEVFTSSYMRQSDGSLLTIEKTQIITVSQWLEIAVQPGTNCTGPVLKKLQSHLRDAAAIEIAPDSVWIPRAATLAKLAETAIQRGETLDPLLLAPLYLRLSYAEEKQPLTRASISPLTKS